MFYFGALLLFLNTVINFLRHISALTDYVTCFIACNDGLHNLYQLIAPIDVWRLNSL